MCVRCYLLTKELAPAEEIGDGVDVRLRRLGPDDAAGLWLLQKALDAQTSFMMYESDERPDDVGATGKQIERTSFVLGAEVGDRLVGYLSAERGAYRRIRHIAYIVIGILAEYHHQGIGRACLTALDDWASEVGVHRLELTVQATNTAAIGLYMKAGFDVEGVRRDAMLVDGVFVDELYMAKILDGQGQ